VQYRDQVDEPFQWIPVDPSGERKLKLDPPERIFIYTVHDGGLFPKRFIKPSIDEVALRRRFVKVRDWGADLVARLLAAELGNGGYARAAIARVLLDFNRFPGTTPRTATDPLDYQAIGQPFGDVLTHAEKMDLLRVYDEMSDAIEQHVDGSFLNIGIHTYDAHNESETKRPHVSLISTPQTYFSHSRMADGLFDPMYPDLLAESSCSRILRDRISLNLERSGFRVIHNHPYPLPDGGIEVRSQVWAFFRYLKQRYEAAHPDTAEDIAHILVWSMLLNTNLRSQEAEALRGYLHRFRRPPSPQERAAFEGARDAYARVHGFVNESTVVSDYRRMSHRPSSIAIEVRKDLLINFDEETGEPLDRSPEQTETAARVAKVIAGAIEIFLNTDRQEDRRVQRNGERG
jgi:hypothetical protein